MLEAEAYANSRVAGRPRLQEQCRKAVRVPGFIEQVVDRDERFKIVGNGSDKPLCDEKNPGADELSLEVCRALNRTTRTAVLTR